MDKFDTLFSNRKNKVAEQMKHAAMVITYYIGELHVATII